MSILKKLCSRSNLVTLSLLVVILAFKTSVLDWYGIPSKSMMPSIEVDDVVIINKMKYGLRVPLTNTYLVRFSSPKIGEVVIFENPEGGWSPYIKRVVAIAGDIVTVTGKHLYVNEVKQECIVVEENSVWYNCEEDLIASGNKNLVRWHKESHMMFDDFEEFQVSENEVFMLGDNRNNSQDGRFYGSFHIDKVYGKHLYTLKDFAIYIDVVFWTLLFIFFFQDVLWASYLALKEKRKEK